MSRGVSRLTGSPPTPDERTLAAALKMCGLKLSDLPAVERFNRSGGISAMQNVAGLPALLTPIEQRRDLRRRTKADERMREIRIAEERRSERLRLKEEARKRTVEQAEVFTDLYMGGMTLKDIGSLYGFRKERVGRIIAARALVTRRDVGRAARVKERGHS